MSVKFKYGTGVKWGTGWKYGFGTSEPWVPGAGAERFAVESLLDPSSDAQREYARLLAVNEQGVLVNRYGSYADESIYLVSPNGTAWRVLINGTTGAISITSGITGSPVGMRLLGPTGVEYELSIDNAGTLFAKNGYGFTAEAAFTPTYTVEVP